MEQPRDVEAGRNAGGACDDAQDRRGKGRALRRVRLRLEVESLADTDPSNREGQRDLTVSLDNVAGLLKYTDPAAALTHYQQSLTITQHLADTDPSNLQARRDVMVTVFSMAELTNRVGDERAPDLARDAVAIAEHLASTRRDRASFTDLTAVLDGAAKIIEASSPDEAAQLRERRDAVRAALDAS